MEHLAQVEAWPQSVIHGLHPQLSLYQMHRHHCVNVEQLEGLVSAKIRSPQMEYFLRPQLDKKKFNIIILIDFI